MNILLLTIATGRYLEFVGPLRASVAAHFLGGHHVEQLLFTNHPVAPTPGLHVQRIAHKSWPAPTLRRYEHFLAAAPTIGRFDFCFYIDADMLIHAPVGPEILGDLVAVRHPYQSFLPPDRIEYDRNPRSRACVPLGRGRTYYAGGFNGGRTSTFLALADTLASWITADRAAGVVARWHDESHLNRYLIDHPPTVELSPAYCYPEEWLAAGPPHAFEPPDPRIIALAKDHAALRGGGRLPRWLRRPLAAMRRWMI